MSKAKKREKTIERLKAKGQLTPEQERIARDINKKATGHEAVLNAWRRLNGK